MTMKADPTLIDRIEQQPDEADRAAQSSDVRYTEEEVFQRVKTRILAHRGDIV